jgi:chemotaxis family two-component system sensor kinase Cph1
VQLRNVLRAQLFAGAAPAEALNQLNEFCVHMMSGAFATVVAARVDLRTGRMEAACAGHLIPYVTNSATTSPAPPASMAASVAAVAAPIRLSPPIGVKGITYEPTTFTIEPGHGLVMYSDGLVERRGEAIDDGLDRLAATLGDAGDASASWIWTAMASGNIDDDVTVVALRRP